jgi:hypothetical protein
VEKRSTSSEAVKSLFKLLEPNCAPFFDKMFKSEAKEFKEELQKLPSKFFTSLNETVSKTSSLEYCMMSKIAALHVMDTHFNPKIEDILEQWSEFLSSASQIFNAKISAVLDVAVEINVTFRHFSASIRGQLLTSSLKTTKRLKPNSLAAALRIFCLEECSDQTSQLLATQCYGNYFF